MQEAKLYQYSPYYKFGTVIYFILGLFVPVMLSRLFITVGFGLVSGTQMPFNFILLGFFSLLMAFIVPITLMNWWQSFEISEKGITFSVFTFWKKFVPWGAIQGIKERRRFLSNKYNKTYVVFADYITPAHYIMGLMYGGKLKPAFTIQANLKDFQEAIERISSRTELIQ